MAMPNEVTPAHLLDRIGTPEAPVIVDVCTDADFDADPYLIPGAWRHPHTDRPGLVARLECRPCVITCQKGRKLSQGMAAALRWDGIAADFLRGGMYAWRDLPDAPRVPAAALPARMDGATLWVTGCAPALDQLACAWLIRRFVDTGARILFVEPAEVAGVAERFGATPFAADCAAPDRRSFARLQQAFGLTCVPLDRMAAMLEATADTMVAGSPQSPGLRAVSSGLSCQHADPVARLDCHMPVFDALYRWARNCNDAERVRT